MALGRIPIPALVIGTIGAAMAIPAALAATDDTWRSARVFLQCGALTVAIAAILGLALATRGHGGSTRRELGLLFLCWIIGPVFAAMPLMVLTPALGAEGAIFDMVAAFTTTGGTAYGDLGAVPRAVHLWRATVGWLGGLLTLMAAYVALAPRRLGGFEIEAATWRMQARDVSVGRIGAGMPPLEARVARAARVILPIYGGLTGLLALLLGAAGQGDLEALAHAMAILSTSGISPDPKGLAGSPSVPAEAIAAVFLCLAASRRLYTDAAEVGSRTPIRRDPELLLMAWLVGAVSLTLVARHWIGALTLDRPAEGLSVVEAAWGSLFTAISFLTTTGFVSGYWETARDWSGWANPGLILLALAAIGGGAATTAGGIKLIRAYALLRHGVREVERIAQPHSVIGIGAGTRNLLREGPSIVWSFMMLFIFAIVVAMLALTAQGLGFERALVASIAAISNTGPAYSLVAEAPQGFAGLDAGQRAVLGLLMVVGRIETFAVVAMLNPDAWRSRRGRDRSGKSRADTPESGW